MKRWYGWYGLVEPDQGAYVAADTEAEALAKLREKLGRDPVAFSEVGWQEPTARYLDAQ